MRDLGLTSRAGVPLITTSGQDVDVHGTVELNIKLALAGCSRQRR